MVEILSTCLLRPAAIIALLTSARVYDRGFYMGLFLLILDCYYLYDDTFAAHSYVNRFFGATGLRLFNLDHRVAQDFVCVLF